MSSFTTAAAAIKTRFYLDKNTIPDLTYEESPPTPSFRSPKTGAVTTAPSRS
jgi:hypothetical protein